MAADVEQLLVDHLTSMLAGSQVVESARVCTELEGLDFDAAGILPLVHVAESPTGARLDPAIDLCEVDIDVYAKALGDRSARMVARDLSEEIRAWVIALPQFGAVADAGLTSVNFATNPGKPVRLPYDNSDVRRWGGMYRLWVHSRA